MNLPFPLARLAMVLWLATSVGTVADSGLGVSSFGAWRPGLITKDDNPHLRTVPFVRRWKELEETKDVYTFADEFDELFFEANIEDLFVTILIYGGQDAPEWVFQEAGEVLTDGVITRFPYYFHPSYQAAFLEFVDAFGAYIRGLPPGYQDRILFVFAAEGATADGAPYKGDLLPGYEGFAITDEEWNVFRITVWDAYKNALPDGMPVMVNFDANTETEDQWLIDNVDTVAIKYGMFSHGYHISDGIQRLADFRLLESRIFSAGKPFLTHGEQDAEIFRHAWGNRNLPQAIYWGGLYATHNPIDIWNVPRELLSDPATWETYIFFNRYAGVRKASESSRAFIALRDGLNAADVTRFPEATYGTATKGNQQRYIGIANTFSSYGARMEDAEAATGGGIKNRQREGYNDAGWNILPGNYSRFMQQINPGTNDVGWWHVDVVKNGSSDADASPYSRFARGFESASGKNEMLFDLDDALFAGTDLSIGTVLYVTYFDEFAGSTWELRYDNGTTMAIAIDTNGVSLSLNGVPLASDLAFYTSSAADLASLQLEGDSVFFDNIVALSSIAPEPVEPYLDWEDSFSLTEAPAGDDDNDNATNLEEFAFGGNPVDPMDRGDGPEVTAVPGGVVLSHAFRDAVLYEMEAKESLDSGQWVPISPTVDRVESLDATYGRVIYELDPSDKDRLFLRLRIEQ